MDKKWLFGLGAVALLGVAATTYKPKKKTANYNDDYSNEPKRPPKMGRKNRPIVVKGNDSGLDYTREFSYYVDWSRYYREVVYIQDAINEVLELYFQPNHPLFYEFKDEVFLVLDGCFNEQTVHALHKITGKYKGSLSSIKGDLALKKGVSTLPPKLNGLPPIDFGIKVEYKHKH